MSAPPPQEPFPAVTATPEAAARQAAARHGTPQGSGTDGPDGRRTAAIVAVLGLAVFMSSLDLFIVNLAFPLSGGSTGAPASARCPGC